MLRQVESYLSFEYFHGLFVITVELNYRNLF